ncbi:MAG: EamA family transporter [Candidatus Pacearchaeota archaeon]|jgi:drug/metabolite transporter (DMT)-like permease
MNGAEFGIIFSVVAMFAWGFGDFLIQKSTRKIGVWDTLFFITFTGFVVLTPFAIKNAGNLFGVGLFLFISGGVVYFIASFLDLEALKIGKLDIVEPIWAFEIVSSVLLAFFILKERVSFLQTVFIIVLILSLAFLSLKKFNFKLGRKFLLEKGVYIALLAAVVMGVANFLIGVGSRRVDPITMKWGMDLFLMVFSFFFVIRGRKKRKFFKSLKKNIKVLTFMSLFDNVAWLAFGFAMVFAPISIAVAISESYIIIAVLLGFFVNKEKLKLHQIIALIIAVISAIYLATSI